MPFWKSGIPAEKFQHSTGAKKSENTCIEKGKKDSFTLVISSLPQGSHSSVSRERHPLPIVSPMWVSKIVASEYLISHTVMGWCLHNPHLSHFTQNMEMIGITETGRCWEQRHGKLQHLKIRTQPRARDPTTFYPCGWLPICNLLGSEWESLQMAHEHIQNASLTLGLRECYTNLSISGYILG